MPETETPQPNSKQDSMTNVHFSEYVKTEWKDGKRLPMSIRINSELYKEFKQVSKALYGSTCRAVENFMAAVVFSAQQKVHFSNTQQPINIGQIVIERNLRPRRALEFTEEIEETTEIKQVKTVKKKQMVVNDLPDYSKMSLEELDKKHRLYQNIGQLGKSALIAAELKRRGAYVK